MKSNRSDSEWFDDGVALFNAGRFFECHEAWEQVWRRARGDDKRAQQGLIQAAAAILHVERGNLIGAASLYAKARAKLEACPDGYMGLAIREFRRALAQYFEIALGGYPAPEPPRLSRTSNRIL